MLSSRLLTCPISSQSFFLAFDSSLLKSQIWSSYHSVLKHSILCNQASDSTLLYNSLSETVMTFYTVLNTTQKQAFLGALFIQPFRYSDPSRSFYTPGGRRILPYGLGIYKNRGDFKSFHLLRSTIKTHIHNSFGAQGRQVPGVLQSTSPFHGCSPTEPCHLWCCALLTAFQGSSSIFHWYHSSQNIPVPACSIHILSQEFARLDHKVELTQCKSKG